jgi:hypothetical protein
VLLQALLGVGSAGATGQMTREPLGRQLKATKEQSPTMKFITDQEFVSALFRTT